MPAPVRALALLLLAALGTGGARARAESFPLPQSLVPRVDFWTRVYSEVGTEGGLVHDYENLGVVYEVVRVPSGSSDRAVQLRADAAKARVRAALRTLAGGARTGLSSTEQRVLAQFPPGVSNAGLRSAADRVRFQRGQADKFRAGLQRMGRWESYIRRALRERGVPEDLKALPHVESSYNPEAHSHAGASGLWQFTRPTGRLYMRVDHVVDERRDPFLASEAAARLLRSNYDRLGTWPLAITAYNHGPGGLAKAVRQLGTRDIGTIVKRYRSPSFGFASRNFYAEFLAARRIDQSPERYFGPLRREAPHDHESVVLRRSYGASSLAQALGLSTAELREWNPALMRPVWSGSRQVPAAYEVRVPRRASHAPASQLVAGVQGQGYRGAPPAPRAAEPPPETGPVVAGTLGPEGARLRPSRPAEAPAAVATIHRVARGETLFEIGRLYGVSMARIAARNEIRDPRDIREGQQLEIPVPGPAAGDSQPPAPEAAVAGAERDAATAPAAAPPENAPTGATPAPIAPPADAPAQPTGPEPASTTQGSSPEPAAPAQPPAAEPTVPAPAEIRSYTIAPGDTLGAIAARLGVGERALAAANGIRDPRRLRPGQVLEIPGADSGGEGPAAAGEAPAEAPAEASYRVRPGDTLGEIARRAGVSAETVASANGIDDPRRLRPGQVLTIPAGGTAAAVQAERFYTVRAGDTLYSIASRHGVSVAELAAENGLRNRHRLSIGQRLRLPPARGSNG